MIHVLKEGKTKNERLIFKSAMIALIHTNQVKFVAKKKVSLIVT
jgi:hypothetical protein